MDVAGTRQSELTERRIAQFTLLLGCAASILATFLYSLRAGAGLLIGALLAWGNFRWLEHAMDSITRASTAQANSPEARVPISSYFGLFVRYALIAVAVYAIFSVFRIPLISMVVGLCALGAAAVVATLIEVLSSSSDSR
jgi:small-conductance mechanosensitive channel